MGDIATQLNSSTGMQQPQDVQACAEPDTPAAHAAAVAPRMLLITGPNASGKSVYMKQVGCAAYNAPTGICLTVLQHLYADSGGD